MVRRGCLRETYKAILTGGLNLKELKSCHVVLTHLCLLDISQLSVPQQPLQHWQLIWDFDDPDHGPDVLTKIINVLTD